MENRYHKWISISVLMCCSVIGYVFYIFVSHLLSYWVVDVGTPIINYSTKAGCAVIALIGYIFLLKNKNTYQFMLEVAEELEHVSWPHFLEIRSLTGLVVVMVFLSGFFLGFLDYCCSQIMKWIL